MGVVITTWHLLSQRDGEKVAEAVTFSDGTTVVRWMRGDLPKSTVVWNSLEDAQRIHEGVGSWKFVEVE